MADLDCRGMNCPEPVKRLRRALGPMAAGQQVRLVCTDPASVIDVDVFCHWYRHTLVSQSREGADLVFVVRKGT